MIFKRLLTVLLIMLIATSMYTPNEVSASANVKELENSLNNSIKIKGWTNAAIYSKRLAVHYDEKKQYSRAVPYYNDSAMYWAKAGHADWGIQNGIRADHIDTQLDLYVERQLPLYQSLGKFEPAGGTYLGLYLAGKREHANPDVVEDIYGKNHAIYLTYAHWRKGYQATDSYFPMAFAAKAKANGSAIQVAWEPSNGLGDVHDDAYVRQFAREAKETGVPVFLRFAGEMNGEWVPWFDDPKKYIEKFRLIHKIMKEEAPNVAMVWSPNFLPVHNIDQYYPGDDVVDWVGLSLYTIPYSHGEEVPGGNPIDYLKPIYDTYSHKPMMISEGAVSHYSYEQNKDYSQWAAGQIGNMYGFLPKMFPQVKAITYFNLDKSTTTYDNQNNNFDIGDSKVVDTRYQNIIKNPYFIDKLAVDTPNKDVNYDYVPAEKLSKVSGTHNAFVYVKLPLGMQPYYVAAYQGKTKIGESYTQPWDMKINFAKVNAKQPITLVAFDKDFKRLATKGLKTSFQHVSAIGKFKDVQASHWAFKAIEQAEEDGIVKGYPGGDYRPNKAVSVAEFMTMLGRSYGQASELEKQAYPKGVVTYMDKMNYPYGNQSSKLMTRTEAAEIVSSTQGMHLTGNTAIKYLLVHELSNGKNPDRISVKDYMGSDTLTRAQSVTFIAHIRKMGAQTITNRPVEASPIADIIEAYDKKFKKP